MSVYVDTPKYELPRDKRARFYGKRFGHRWCRLFADTFEELHAAAAAIGVTKDWFQAKPLGHYVMSPKARAKAIDYGAKAMGREDIIRQILLKARAKAEKEREEARAAEAPVVGVDLASGSDQHATVVIEPEVKP